MPVKHFDHEGQVRFVTFSTHQRVPILTDHAFQRIVVDAITEVKVAYYLKILGYVIMPEHVHIVCIPPLESKLGPIIGEIKRISAKKIHENLIENLGPVLDRLTARRVGEMKFVLWEKRCYDHNCRTEESVWEKVNYCHDNPVKRGLVNKLSDWQWSSSGWYEGRRNFGLEIDTL